MSLESNVFDSLVKPIKHLIKERGFTDPTYPQSEAIPLILEGKNVLLISPTSTGKTEAAFLPVLQMIISAPRAKGIKLIYITPLRALNRDLLDRLLWWCGKLDLGVSVRHGDTGTRERREQALKPPDIMITTPETLQVLLNGRLLRQHLKSVRWVIIDEVHELADSKRGSQLSLSLEKLRWTIGSDFQVIGLSATVGTPNRVAKFLVGDERGSEIVYVPVGRRMILEIIYPKPEAEDYDLASRLYTFPEVAARLRAMKAFIKEHGSSLLFTNTRPMSEILTSRFRIWDLGFPMSVHHGSLSSLSRMRAERGLKGGSLKGVVCTSSLELGLDVGTIELCIQYNSPRQVTRLIQRVGRSGHRIGGTARGVIVVQNSDDALESLVIAKRALEEKLEPVVVPEKPLDVLMHELAGLLIVKRSWDLDEACGIVSKAQPYRNLVKEDLEKLLEYMSGLTQKLAWFSSEEEVFSRSKYKRLFRYYYDNLSMIPVVKQFFVINEEENLPVGILDEEFVTENGEPGIKFVMGGSVWRIIQVFRDRVYVKPDQDPIGAIPSWVGEEIPVPFSVAQEVGAMRRKVEELVRDGKTLEDVSKILAEEYSASPEMIARALNETYHQLKSDSAVPTDRRMTVERWGKMLILHSSCGTLTNRTIARYLGHRIIEVMGEPVSVFEDPYRVFVRSEHVSPEELMDMLREGGVEELWEVLRSSIEESRFFKRRLSQIARRMGAVRRDVELTSSLMNQLMKGLKETPVFEEAFQEVAQNDLDFDGTISVLKEIRGGEIELFSFGEREEATPIAQVGLTWMSGKLENVSPDRLRVLAVASTKARLLSELRTLICINCKKYVEEEYVKEMDEVIKCPICGSTQIGMVEESEEDVYRVLDLMGRTTGRSFHRKIWRKALDAANLISSYGKRAAIVLASESLSIDQAKEILKDVKMVSSRLFEAINEAERTNIMKRFSKA